RAGRRGSAHRSCPRLFRPAPRGTSRLRLVSLADEPDGGPHDPLRRRRSAPRRAVARLDDPAGLPLLSGGLLRGGISGLPPHGQFLRRWVSLQYLVRAVIRLVSQRLALRVPVPEVLVRNPPAPGELQLLQDREHAKATGAVTGIVKEVDAGQRLRQDVDQRDSD